MTTSTIQEAPTRPVIQPLDPNSAHGRAVAEGLTDRLAQIRVAIERRRTQQSAA